MTSEQNMDTLDENQNRRRKFKTSNQHGGSETEEKRRKKQDQQKSSESEEKDREKQALKLQKFLETHKTNMKKKAEYIFECKKENEAHLKEVYTELFITEGDMKYVNQELHVFICYLNKDMQELQFFFDGQKQSVTLQELLQKAVDKAMEKFHIITSRLQETHPCYEMLQKSTI
ncbi:hypothetical protein QQF64_035752 [Cirrhinus molitorella]|uniref:FISNA domain-containing protein n=1 Tax=Cirrhinus molitorella TaxID=172907 RepID=A0ABR3NGU2_9TELE